MSLRRACLILLVSGLAFAAKKNKAEITQTLELPKEPPVVAVGEVKKLIFQVSPLSTSGLLSQQTRDAMKTLMRLNPGAQFIHVRAFVAGNGDVRRVPQIVSDVLSEKKQPLPSISVVRAGGLALENSQVVLEVVLSAKKELSNAGLEFADSGFVTVPDAASPPRSLLEKALDALVAKAPSAGTVQVTCFVSTMTADLTRVVAAKFPGSAVNVVMTQRGPSQGFAGCQSMRRAGARADDSRLAFTGTRVAFGHEEKDAALAFQRLDRDLAEAVSGPPHVVVTNVYALSVAAGERVRKVRTGAQNLLAIPTDGVAAVEAAFAVDAIAKF